MLVFSKLGFAEIYAASYVSNGFLRLAARAFKAAYGIRRTEKIFLNYTILIQELDEQLQAAGQTSSIVEVNATFRASPRFTCYRSILEAQFGYCFTYSTKNLPKFSLEVIPYDTLNDERRISVLPYFIEQNPLDFHAIYLIRGLVELGRFDLLCHMTFPQITLAFFNRILSTAVPDSVIRAAAKSLQKTEPELEVLSWLALAGMGTQVAPLSEDFRMPLSVFRFLHEKKVLLQESLVLIDGLEEASIPFWMSVSKAEIKDANDLLDFLIKHGDSEVKQLASAFYGPVPAIVVANLKKDVYRAMLIRFRFGFVCNEHIVSNFESMLKTLSNVGYHTACALLDCGQAQELAQHAFDYSLGINFGPVVDKIYRSKEQGVLNQFIDKHFKRAPGGPQLLKWLIKRGADESYIQVVWDAIQIKTEPLLVEYHCCSMPLSMLKRLLLEQDISLATVWEMLRVLQGYKMDDEYVRKEVHVLYTVIFWEALEGIIDHFLDRILSDCELDYRLALGLLRMTKYSSEFLEKLLQRCGMMPIFIKEELGKFRSEMELNPDAFSQS